MQKWLQKSHAIYQNNKQTSLENKVKPVELVKMKVYQNNTYKEDLSWLHFSNEPRVQEKQQEKTNHLAYLFLQSIQQFQVATRSIIPGMIAVFSAWLYGRFVEIQSNLRKKKLHRTNQNSNFEKKVNTSILKDDFSSRTDPFILTYIVPVLLDWSNKRS